MSSSAPSDQACPGGVPQVVSNEERLAALRRYDVLDTDPEAAFDRVANLSAHLFNAPAALVNFVDTNRQWFKSTVGLEELGGVTQKETGLDVSFCVYTVEKEDVLVVEDLSEDERFEDNPFVTDYGVRFYAGAPLITPDGHSIGTVCVLGTEPRSPTEETVNRLTDLAAIVMDELELRREQADHEETLDELEENQKLLRKAQKLASVGGSAYDPQTEEVTWTEETYRIFGLSPETSIDLETAVELYAPGSRSSVESEVARLLEEGGTYDLEVDAVTAQGERRRLRTIAEAKREDGETTQIVGAVQDITQQHRNWRLTEIQSHFFERIATGASIDEVLHEIAQFTEEELLDVAVSVLRVDDDRLYHAAGSSLPAQFVEAIDGTEVGPEVGACGAAANSGRRVVTEDIQEDTRWEGFRPPAERADFRSCSSQVIQGSDGTIVGTFTVYRNEAGRPNPFEQRLVERMSHVASVALEREQHERALRKSEEKLRTVVENAQPMTFMVDRDGTILLSEGEDLACLGLEPGETVGESAYDRYANHPAVITAVQRALEGEHVNEEVHVDDLIFDTWYSPFYDQEGEVAGVIGMAADITERQKAQLNVRKQKEMLQTLVDNVPVMITLVEDGQIQMINDHVEEVLGWTDEHATSDTDLLEQFYPEPEQRRRVRKAIREAPDEWQDFQPARADGVPVDTTWKNVRLPDGRTIGIGVDISDRKERERELRDSNQRLRLALEAANAGTFVHDLHTGQVRWDDRSVELFGFDLDSHEQDPELLKEVVFDDDFERLEETFVEAVEEKASRFDISFRIRRADDGAVRHIRSAGTVLVDENGTPSRVIGINQDVTERRQRERALARQNDLFAKAQDIADVGAWEYDITSTDLTWTEETYHIHGLSPAIDLIPETAIGHYHPDDQRQIREAFTRAVEEGEPYDLELRLRTDEGKQRWVRTRGEPQWENGELVRVRGTIQDITEQKETEQNLRRSREQLSMAVEGGNIGTWNWDLDTDEVIFNRRWAEMLGFSREELDFNFSTWEDLVHPEDLPRAMEELSAYIEGETNTYAPEIRMRTKSGGWKWIQTIGKVVEQGEEGGVTRAAGIHLDIDERKRAEKAVREAQSRYQTLIEHFPEGGVFLFDTDLEYKIAGGKGLEQIGLSPTDFAGKTPRDLFPEEIAEPQMRFYRRALEGEKSVFEQTYQGRHYRLQTLPVRSAEGEVVAGMAVSQDITERKETRRRLERYKEYTDRLLDAVDDLFFAIDDEARFQRWNARIPEVTGYTDDELRTMTAFDLVPESERERVATKVSTAFGEGRAQIEVPLLRKDGSTIPYEFAGSLVEHPEGGLQVVGIGRDVTERNERERLLRQAETFFQNAQDALFLIDVQQVEGESTFSVQRVNPAYEAQTGFFENDIRGATPEELFGTEAAQRTKARYRTCVERREPLEFEEEVTFDEATMHWTTRIAPVVVDGEVRQIVGTTRDITERERRKQTLARQNDLFSKAQDIANVGAWEYDVQSGKAKLTDEAYRIYGLDQQEKVTPERSIACFHPDDQPEIENAITRAVENGTAYDLELRLTPEEGEQRWVRTRGEPQKENGEIVRVRGTIQDVTERVRRREELKEAKETAVEADRIKSALLSNMNHELRTPLTSIISFSEIISEDPDVAGEFADRILGGGKRLLHTLNTVMDFAELEADPVSPTPKHVDLGALAQSAVDGFSHRIERKGLSVDVSEPGGNTAAFLDEHVVERVLSHLVSNAVKFTQEGDEVSVSVTVEADTATLRVTDTGVGMDPEFVPRAFDQFAQASSGNARTHDGNGLGLTIVKQMVEQMGGAVSLDSTPGEGTTVTVQLPIIDRTQNQAQASVDDRS